MNQQRLLIDTDIYCKLGVSGLLTDVLGALRVPVEECGRLPALSYMLRRGRLRKRFGSHGSDALALLAQRFPIAIQPTDEWLDPLTSVPSIDPGEAQLLATTAERGMLLLTGDKRGLQGVKDIPDYTEALNGRIIILEAILADLCVRIGTASMRARICPLMRIDTTVRICFSDSNSSPLDGLVSYYNNLASSLEPLHLWRPTLIGAT